MSQANFSEFSTVLPNASWRDAQMNTAEPNYGYPSSIEVVASLIYFSLLSCAIVCGNLLVIAAYERNWRLQTITNTFILGLAVADLIVGVVSIPFWLYVYSCHYFQRKLHPAGYKFYITFDVFIGCASIFQLTAISIERCIAIVWPLRHRTIHQGKFLVMIYGAWASAASLAALYPIQLGHWQRSYSTMMFLVCFAGPLVVLFVVYIIIYETAVNSNARVSPSGIAWSVHREIRVASTVALVTGLFIFAWLPFFVITVMATYDIESLPEPPFLVRLIAVVKVMHYTNSGLNPLVYSCRNPEMRRTMTSIVKKWLPSTPQSSTPWRRPRNDVVVKVSGDSQTSEFDNSKNPVPILVTAYVNGGVEVESQPTRSMQLTTSHA